MVWAGCRILSVLERLAANYLSSMQTDVSSALFPLWVWMWVLRCRTTCVHVLELDKKEALAGEMMWVVIQSLSVLCCVTGCCKVSVYLYEKLRVFLFFHYYKFKNPNLRQNTLLRHKQHSFDTSAIVINTGFPICSMFETNILPCFFV